MSHHCVGSTVEDTNVLQVLEVNAHIESTLISIKFRSLTVKFED